MLPLHLESLQADLDAAFRHAHEGWKGLHMARQRTPPVPEELRDEAGHCAVGDAVFAEVCRRFVEADAAGSTEALFVQGNAAVGLALLQEHLAEGHPARSGSWPAVAQEKYGAAGLTPEQALRHAARVTETYRIQRGL